MANYTASALAAAQVAYSEQFNQPELRRKQNPALMLALKNQQTTIINHQQLKSKDTRPVKAYLRTRKAAGAGAAKSHAHAGTKADSKEVTLAWITIVETFSIHLKQDQANIFPYADMLRHELTEAARNIHDRAGTLGLAYLQSNRDQRAGLATGGAGTWSAVNKVLEIAAADKDFFFQNAESFMRTQNYRGRYDVIADQKQFRKAQYIQNQGAGNNTNLGWQIGNMEIVETTEAIDANYANGSVLMMLAGTFAGLPWNDPVNLKGKGDYDSYNGGFGTVLDPLGSGQIFDFHAYTERADGSALGGGVQDEVLQAELAYTIGWALAPSSVANESPVFEIAQMV